MKITLSFIIGMLMHQLSYTQNSLLGEWELLSLKDNTTDSLYIPTKQLLLKVNSDSIIKYTPDVNTCILKYKVIEEKIVIYSGGSCTKICCDKPNPIIFYRNFKDTLVFNITDDKLTIKASSDILTYKKK